MYFIFTYPSISGCVFTIKLQLRWTPSPDPVTCPSPILSCGSALDFVTIILVDGFFKQYALNLHSVPLIFISVDLHGMHYIKSVLHHLL